MRSGSVHQQLGQQSKVRINFTFLFFKTTRAMFTEQKSVSVIPFAVSAMGERVTKVGPKFLLGRLNDSMCKSFFFTSQFHSINHVKNVSSCFLPLSLHIKPYFHIFHNSHIHICYIILKKKKLPGKLQPSSSRELGFRKNCQEPLGKSPGQREFPNFQLSPCYKISGLIA